MVWLQAKGYYNSNISQNGFGMGAVVKVWGESLEQVCSLCSMTTKQRHALSHEIHPITNLVEF
jgi:hypothetical protein